MSNMFTEVDIRTTIIIYINKNRVKASLQ